MKLTTFRHSVFAAFFVLFFAGLNLKSQDNDPVLTFYVSEADSVFVRTSASNSSTKFSFEAFSYYKSIGRGGAVTNIDSMSIRYFFTGEVLDSTRQLLKPKKRVPDITFNYPNVFDRKFEHSFFPNDIGGAELAIGFATDSSIVELPEGIAIVDREKFTLKQVYLHIPPPEGFKRLTRSYRFVEFGHFIFPDSIWEIGAKHGVFTTEYYRLETKLGQIQLLR